MSNGKEKEQNQLITKTQGKQFRFEDYKTAEDAQEALNKIYPVGSEAEKVVADLEGIGCSCSYDTGVHITTESTLNWYKLSAEKRKDIIINGDDSKKIKTIKNEILCSYFQKPALLVGWLWYITVHIDDQNKIKNIFVQKQYSGP